MAATFTTRLGLRKPDPTPVTGDLVDALADLNNNFDKIDAALAVPVITSTTRPSSPFVGMGAFETDTLAEIICVSIGPPVWRYTSTPTVSNVSTIPTTNLLPGQLAVQTVDNKIYRWTGTTWLPATVTGIIGETRRVSADNVTSLVVMEQCTVNIINGRKYRIDWNFNHASNILGPPNGTLAIRTAVGATITTSSAVIRTSGLLINSATYQSGHLMTTYTATATEQRTFGITATSNGVPVITFEGGTDRRILTVTAEDAP